MSNTTKKLFNLSVIVDRRKDGSAIYLPVGVMLQDHNGPFILLNKHFNPAGVADTKDKSTIKVAMFEPEPYDPNKSQF